MMQNNKIGLCVCYNTKNYGSMLQTLATTIQVENLGYDYEILVYTRKLTLNLLMRSLGRIPEMIAQKNKQNKRLKAYRKYPEIQQGIIERNRCFDEFMHTKFTKMSKRYDTYEQIHNAAREYCAVLVGSDQLWRPEGYSTGFYNLMFVPDEIKKIAYATSFGVSQIPEKKKKSAKLFLNRIEHISVRELRASEIIKELIGRDVPTVVDPTLLFTGEEWNKIIPDNNVRPADEKYIFCYLLGNNEQHRKQVEKLKAETGYKIVTIPHLDEFVQSDVAFGDEHLYNIGPAEFVNLIRHASYICTDSFHGTVFSILNHKQFLTFSRFADSSKNSRNSRIESLFSQLKLEQRHFIEGDIVSKMQKSIDYDTVETYLTGMRNYSVNYLKDSLKDM